MSNHWPAMQKMTFIENANMAHAYILIWDHDAETLRAKTSAKGAHDAAVDQGPVVQSVVSLKSSLRVILLTVLADSIYNILTFLLKNVSSKSYSHFFSKKVLATHIFSAKNFSIFAYHSM